MNTSNLVSSHPYDPKFYFSTLISVAVILAILQGLIYYFKQQLSQVEADDATLNKSRAYSLNLAKRKDGLWFRYMIGYISARASMWAKSPYLYMLYSTYHGFTINEIGVLYAIDSGTALICGPILGNLSDIFGRKLFSVLYNVLVISNLLMRLTGIKGLAYLAQVLTGMGAGLLMTTYESWIVYEANKEFRSHEVEKDRFLKKLFKSQNLIDACASIVVSGICALSYYSYGVMAPILISIALCLVSGISITFLWDENRPGQNQNSTTLNQFSEAFEELKKREVLTVGIMESFWQAVLNIFIFAWTPILQHTTTEKFNPGMVFITFVMLIIAGTKVYELVCIYLKSNLYISLASGILVELIAFTIILMVPNNFMLTYICLGIINGMCGYYQPINSIIKAKIIKEKVRALMMNIFRIPLNLYVVSALLFLKNLDPKTVRFFK